MTIMKDLYKSILTIFLVAIMIAPVNVIKAGNEDRSGEAGAFELLINPWGRSSGWGGVNIANSRGLEASFTNIAGTAFTLKTEIGFAQTQWLKGSDVNISAFGFMQKVGEAGVLGITIVSMSFGDVPITTVNQPEGGIGTYSPSFLNIGISYAKAFSNSIYGGINLKIISESIADVTAQGIALDAGIQYITGKTENIKFGISLKNVGTKMKFTGDGLSFQGFIQGQESTFTVEQRSVAFELPSLLNIGLSYDFNISEIHRVTAAGAFTSNSFTKDQYTVGLEYGFRNVLMLRGAFTYQDGIFSDLLAERGTAYTGPSLGFSVQVPLNKDKASKLSIDYSYRATDPFEGTHTIGAILTL